MIKVTVFDPPMCCASGVCGPNPNPLLPRFAADLKWLQSQDIEVSRYNLAQQPEVFIATEPVRTALQDQGEECLPLMLVDDVIVCSGRYPSRDELSEFVNLSLKDNPSIYSEQVSELVAIGAAAAANCEFCLRYHTKQAKDLGISDADMAQAFQTGLMVKQMPAQRLMTIAQRLGLSVVSDEFDSGEPGSCCDPTSGCCGGDEDESEETVSVLNASSVDPLSDPHKQGNASEEKTTINNQNELTPKKKNSWAILKEFMFEANSDCEPGCSCNSTAPASKRQPEEPSCCDK